MPYRIPAGGDIDAVHVDVAGEFGAVSLKASPANDDRFLIEDSADGYSKKYVLFSALSGGGGLAAVVDDTTPQLGGDLDANGHGFTGVTKVAFGAWTSATIAAGVVSASSCLMEIDGETGAADELDTLTHVAGVDMVFLRIKADANNITLNHNTGNVFLLSAASLELDNTEEMVLLVWNPDDSKWAVIAGGGGGSGSVGTSGTPVANDFAQFTDPTTIRGRNYAEVKADLSLDNVDNVSINSWAGSANVVTLGTITSGGLGTGAVVGGVTMTLGSDGTGDMYYRNAGGVLTRVPIGTESYVMTVVSGLPAWAEAAGGGGASVPLWIQWE